MTMELPTFAQVRGRFIAPDDDPPVSLETAALQGAPVGSEAERILRYLHGLGVEPTSLRTLYEGIVELEDEEELSAFECQEGVAVTQASEGWWLLFVEDDA